MFVTDRDRERGRRFDGFNQCGHNLSKAEYSADVDKMREENEEIKDIKNLPRYL